MRVGKKLVSSEFFFRIPHDRFLPTFAHTAHRTSLGRLREHTLYYMILMGFHLPYEYGSRFSRTLITTSHLRERIFVLQLDNYEWLVVYFVVRNGPNLLYVK